MAAEDRRSPCRVQRVTESPKKKYPGEFELSRVPRVTMVRPPSEAAPCMDPLDYRSQFGLDGSTGMSDPVTKK